MSALEEIAKLQPRALAMIQANGFVFDVDLAAPPETLDEVGRWQKLAFSLYTDLCEANSLARADLVDDLDGDRLTKAWHRAFHSQYGDGCANDAQFAGKVAREYRILTATPPASAGPFSPQHLQQFGPRGAANHTSPVADSRRYATPSASAEREALEDAIGVIFRLLDDHAANHASCSAISVSAEMHHAHNVLKPALAATPPASAERHRWIPAVGAVRSPDKGRCSCGWGFGTREQWKSHAATPPASAEHSHQSFTERDACPECVAIMEQGKTKQYDSMEDLFADLDATPPASAELPWPCIGDGCPCEESAL